MVAIASGLAKSHKMIFRENEVWKQIDWDGEEAEMFSVLNEF